MKIIIINPDCFSAVSPWGLYIILSMLVIGIFCVLLCFIFGFKETSEERVLRCMKREEQKRYFTILDWYAR